MAFIICVAALIIMMFVFTQMLLSFSNNSSAAVESVDATVVEKKQGIYTHMQSEAHVPWFRVVFEMTDGSLMEFQMHREIFVNWKRRSRYADLSREIGIYVTKNINLKVKHRRKKMLSESIAKLVQYGITTGLTPECERNYNNKSSAGCFHEMIMKTGQH